MPDLATASIAEIYAYYQPRRGSVLAHYICDQIAIADTHALLLIRQGKEER